MKKIVLLLVIFILNFKSNAQINPDTIQIVRDAYGVPHIYAPTDAALAYGFFHGHKQKIILNCYRNPIWQGMDFWENALEKKELEQIF